MPAAIPLRAPASLPRGPPRATGRTPVATTAASRKRQLLRLGRAGARPRRQRGQRAPQGGQLQLGRARAKLGPHAVAA
eukprot:431486-Prymnesium_polylepis.1